MSFNLLHAVVSGAESFLMSGGNPIAAGIGAIEGGCQQQQQAPAIPSMGLDPTLLNDALGDQSSLLEDTNLLSNFAKVSA